MVSEHKEISPTADIVVLLRKDTDIPYCKEIADMLDIGPATAYFKGDPEQIAIRRPLVELRFKALNGVIRQLGFNQVLELAGGLAPRGLILSQSPLMLFVETDLPDKLSEKRMIVERILGDEKRPNYKMYAANALSEEELRSATEVFKKEPVTIVHEGLMQYLDLSEKKQLAVNIHGLLEKYGGAWITTDVVTKEYFQRFYSGNAGAAMVKTVADASKRDISDNAFTDQDEAMKFFQDAGFIVRHSKQIEFVPEMRNRGFSPELQERVEYEELWMMCLNS